MLVSCLSEKKIHNLCYVKFKRIAQPLSRKECEFTSAKVVGVERIRKAIILNSFIALGE